MSKLVSRAAELHSRANYGFNDVHLKPFVVVIGSVEDGEDTRQPEGQAVSAGDREWGQGDGSHRLESHRICLMRAVSSWTRLYTDLSSRMSRAILEVAWMTVV